MNTQTTYPTFTNYGKLSYTQSIKVSGLSDGCKSFYSATEKGYLSTLSESINSSFGRTIFLRCVDESHSLNLRKKRPLLSQPSADSILSARISVSLSLYAHAAIHTASQQEFGFSIYKYLGNLCKVSVNNGSFSTLFKELINGTKDSNNYADFYFFNASTSNYTIDYASSLSSTATTTSVSPSFLIIAVTAGAGLFICLLCIGYYLGLHKIIRNKAFVHSSKPQPADNDIEEAGLSNIYQPPHSDLEVVTQQQQHENPLVQAPQCKPNLGGGKKIGVQEPSQAEEKIEKKRSDNHIGGAIDRRKLAPVIGPSISLIQHYLDREDDDDDGAFDQTVREVQVLRYKSLKYGRLYGSRMKRVMDFSEDTTTVKKSLVQSPLSARRKASISSSIAKKVGVAPLVDPASTSVGKEGDESNDAIDDKDIYLGDTSGEDYSRY